MGDLNAGSNSNSPKSSQSNSPASQPSRKISDTAIVPTPSSVSTGSPSPAAIARKRSSIKSSPTAPLQKLSTSSRIITGEITGNEVAAQKSIPASQDSPLSPPRTLSKETSPEGRRSSLTMPRRRSSSMRRVKKSSGLSVTTNTNGPLLESPTPSTHDQEHESSTAESPRKISRSISLQKEQRKDSKSSLASKPKPTRSESVTLPILRKTSEASMGEEKRSAASSPGIRAETPKLPPIDTEPPDFTKVLRLIDPNRPRDGVSGEVLRMWSHLSQEDLEESTKQLPESRRREILSLIAELQHWNQVKDEVDAGPSRKTYLPPVQVDPGDDPRASKASSHPYNVAFESDDASISVDGKKPRRSDAVPNPAGVLAQLIGQEDPDSLQKILDDWYRGLRQALLTANAAAHERIISRLNRSMQDLMKSQQQESDRLHSDIDSLHTLCGSYSKAIYQRDRTIANLSEALANQKEQTVLAQSLKAMKTEVADNRREAIQEKLATSFYEKKLAQKVWFGWQSMQREGWKQRTEKACQQRAEEVCHKMADQYDSKIAELEEIIRKLREDNKRLREERDQVNQKARGALLHGVSVLRGEAEQFPSDRIRSEEDGASGMYSRKESREAMSGSDASDRTVHSRSGRESNDGEEEAAKPARSRNSSQARSQASRSSSQNSRKPSNSSNRPSSKNDNPQIS